MTVAFHDQDLPGAPTASWPDRVDPLGFLQGRRYVCYCGASLTATTLCPECARKMLERLVWRPITENGQS